MNPLESCHDIGDLRAAARRRLPRAVFDFIDGGAEDEVTLRGNRSGFGRYDLVPEVLTDVADLAMTTTVMGQDIAYPLILAPTGMSRIFHRDGERAVAAAAAKAGIIYSLSSASSVSIEEIGALTQGPKWFQIYVWRDRSLVRDFIARARAADFQALCLTVDVQVLGNRQRDLHNGLTVPPRFTPRLVLDLAWHPRWWLGLLAGPPLEMANVVGKAPGADGDLRTMMRYVDSQFDRSVTWDDAAWMIREWGGPFAIKGILSAEDARRAIDIGVAGIIVSNHGGRQLDQAAAPIDVLPEIVDAVAGRADVILDGGVRRGTDVVKALALGAKACMVGRPYLYGLAAGGGAGVARALGVFRSEIERDLRLVGAAIDDLGPRHLRLKDVPRGYPFNR
ncbi:MAG: alpha-hydroxy acid oxidase [Alphaproteobacteria bacterium]|jgi:L-lactate dehydrogenase (cytochrome)|nr:alpha-hydroxy acid oxidase [Alphaproteobacteria bacterium]MDP6517366.1 alpha-hydroxy acid oxidase [Alphaproteobacteria bacterium]